MSENELTTTSDETLTLDTLGKENTQVSKYDDNVFDGLGTGGRFLPRIQLVTANSDKCKKPASQGGGFPVNHYALVQGKTYQDIGESVDLLCVAWRPKALDMNDDIITVYNPNDAEFKRIQELSEQKDSGGMWGYEFLCWVGSLGQFATFFMGSKSARNEAPNLKALINQFATLRSVYIEGKKHSWQAPQVVACSTPLTSMPTRSQLTGQVDKFNNPPKQEVERAEEGRDV